LRLFGLVSSRWDAVASVSILGVVLATRLMVFPASIWEQDEAYFGCGVLRFEPLANHPHPPWFPLWIFIGKLTRGPVDDPILGLQAASLVASAWVLFPLVSLWSLWLRRDLAVVSSLVFLFVPGTWFLSGRAFSEPLAVALLVLTGALCLRREPALHEVIGGSLAAAFCLLTRAHYMLPVLLLVGCRLVKSGTLRHRIVTVVPLVLVIAVGYGAVAVSAGGVVPLWGAVRSHGTYHFSELAGATLTFQGSGLARALISPGVAVAWVLAAWVGAVVLWRHRARSLASTRMLLLVIALLVVTTHWASWGGHVRYLMPITALTSGLVVVAVARFAGRFAPALIAMTLVLVTWRAVPAAAVYRVQTSPPVQALDAAVAEAGRLGAVIVADRTLASFIELERLRRGLPFTVLYDDQIGVDTPPPPEWATVAIYDALHDEMVADAQTRRLFGCEDPWLRRLSQGRFLDMVVASQARISLFPPNPADMTRRKP
jgi:hypothetical protein